MASKNSGIDAANTSCMIDANKKTNVINMAEKRHLKMMSNKVNYITAPDDSFLYSNDKLSDHYEQLGLIKELCSPTEDLDNFDGFILGLITLAYFRLKETRDRTNIDIPVEALLAPVKFNPNSYFPMDIFDHYKVICKDNNIFDKTIKIFEPYLVRPECDNFEILKDNAERMLHVDWSDNAFNKEIEEKLGGDFWNRKTKKRAFSCADQVIGLYVEGEVMFDFLTGVYRPGSADCSEHAKCRPEE